MEQHYLKTSYINDLQTLIFEAKHNLVRNKAELNVLEGRIGEIKEECLNISKEIKKLDDSSKATEDLKQDLFARHGFLMYMQDRERTVQKEHGDSLEKFNALMAQKLHYDLHHAQS